MRLRERARLSAALTRCALIRYRCKLGLDLSNPVGLRHDGNSQNASRRPSHFAWPTHPQKLQSAKQRASLTLDLLSLGSAALGVSFLLSVSDRLGFYGNPGERGVSWGTFERFLGYAAKVNAFAPAWIIPFVGTAATVLELLFGRLSAARACSSYSVQPWRSRLGSSRHSTTLYSLRCAAPFFWVSPARIDGPSTLYYDATSEAAPAGPTAKQMFVPHRRFLRAESVASIP